MFCSSTVRILPVHVTLQTPAVPRSLYYGVVCGAGTAVLHQASLYRESQMQCRHEPNMRMTNNHRCQMYMYDVHFLCGTQSFLSSGRQSSLAISAAEHAGGSRVHHGANANPGRGPSRVLWAFEVANSGENYPEACRPARARTMETPQF